MKRPASVQHRRLRGGPSYAAVALDADCSCAQHVALLVGVWMAMTMVSPGAAQAQQGPFVYVPDILGNDVTVIDTPTNTVAPTAVPVGSAPLAAAVRGDQSLVYVTNSGNNTVSVINAATNTAVATVPVGNSAYTLALSPDNTRAYVANQGSDMFPSSAPPPTRWSATIPVGSRLSVPRSPPTALACM